MVDRLNTYLAAELPLYGIACSIQTVYCSTCDKFLRLFYVGHYDKKKYTYEEVYELLNDYIKEGTSVLMPKKEVIKYYVFLLMTLNNQIVKI